MNFLVLFPVCRLLLLLLLEKIKNISDSATLMGDFPKGKCQVQESLQLARWSRTIQSIRNLGAHRCEWIEWIIFDVYEGSNWFKGAQRIMAYSFRIYVFIFLFFVGHVVMVMVVGCWRLISGAAAQIELSALDALPSRATRGPRKRWRLVKA